MSRREKEKKLWKAGKFYGKDLEGYCNERPRNWKAMEMEGRGNRRLDGREVVGSERRQWELESRKLQR